MKVGKYVIVFASHIQLCNLSPLTNSDGPNVCTGCDEMKSIRIISTLLGFELTVFGSVPIFLALSSSNICTFAVASIQKTVESAMSMRVYSALLSLIESFLGFDEEKQIYSETYVIKTYSIKYV